MLTAIASIASIAGLVFSIWTLLVARGARRAAGEAREAVRKGNAAEELRNLSTIANEFLSHVDHDQVSEACMRARDLMSAMNTVTRRWGRFLSTTQQNELEEAYGQISVISRSLSANGAPTTPQQKDKLLRICHGVVKTLSAGAGTLYSEVEREEEN